MKQILVMFAIVLLLVAASVDSTRRQLNAKSRHPHMKYLAMGAKIELYRLDTGLCPESLSELVMSSAPDWHGPYARPQDLLDRWGRAIRYERSAGGLRCAIRGLGADDLSGGTDEAEDIHLEY